MFLNSVKRILWDFPQRRCPSSIVQARDFRGRVYKPQGFECCATKNKVKLSRKLQNLDILFFFFIIYRIWIYLNIVVLGKCTTSQYYTSSCSFRAAAAGFFVCFVNCKAMTLHQYENWYFYDQSFNKRNKIQARIQNDTEACRWCIVRQTKEASFTIEPCFVNLLSGIKMTLAINGFLYSSDIS